MALINDENIPLAVLVEHFIIHGKATWAHNSDAFLVSDILYLLNSLFWIAVDDQYFDVFIFRDPSSDLIHPIVHQSGGDHHHGFVYQALEF